MYPMDQSEYQGLRSAIERLTLNDSSVTVQRDSSLALGAGWRWGQLLWIRMKNGFKSTKEEWLSTYTATANEDKSVDFEQCNHEKFRPASGVIMFGHFSSDFLLQKSFHFFLKGTNFRGSGKIYLLSSVATQTSYDMIDRGINNFPRDRLYVAKIDSQVRVYLSSWVMSVQMV